MTTIGGCMVNTISWVLAKAGLTEAHKQGGHVLPDGYQAQAASAKRDYLWSQIEATAYDAAKPPKMKMPPLRDVAGLFNKEYLAKAFDHVSDVMLPDRKKAIHPYGVAAKADFVPVAGQPYTGFFQGAQALVRLSLASITGYTPGMGVKFFVDGKPSENIFVMFSLDGQGENRDFFANAFTHRIPMPKSGLLKKLAEAFSQVKRNPNDLDLDHLASVKSDGAAVENPATPHQIILVPNEAVKGKIAADSENDFRADLIAAAAAGTTLYDVYAVATPGAERVLIGALKLASDFKASRFGDEELYFQHNKKAG